jgi:hypothetical protein
MMFELLFNVMDRFLNTWISSVLILNIVTPIIESVRASARVRPYPTGRLRWAAALPQALHARLRSHRPSWTKNILRAEALIRLALMTVNPGTSSPDPSGQRRDSARTQAFGNRPNVRVRRDVSLGKAATP